MNCKVCGREACEFAPKGQVWLCKTCKKAYTLGYKQKESEAKKELEKILEEREEAEERRLAEIREDDAYYASLPY